MREGRREDRELLPGSPASNQRQLLIHHNRPCGRCGAVKVDDQIGLEEDLGAYVARLVEVFDAVRRVLANDGTLWLNLGDTYTRGRRGAGLKPKDLAGVPWTVALALRDAGWYLRSEVVWDKVWTRPEGGARDRPSRRHEHLFLLSKSRRYFYRQTDEARHSVWSIRPSQGRGDHRAQFPEELPVRCIEASTDSGDVVLDPFIGSGTTALAAVSLGRRYLGVELSAAFAKGAHQRIATHQTQIAALRRWLP